MQLSLDQASDQMVEERGIILALVIAAATASLKPAALEMGLRVAHMFCLRSMQLFVGRLALRLSKHYSGSIISGQTLYRW